MYLLYIINKVKNVGLMRGIRKMFKNFQKRAVIFLNFKENATYEN